MQQRFKHRLPKSYQKHRALVRSTASFPVSRDVAARNEFLECVYRACRVLRKLDEEELRAIKLRKHSEGTFASLLGHFLRFAGVDRRLASKWAAALKYAQTMTIRSDDLLAFIEANGGINSCGDLLREVTREKRRHLRSNPFRERR